MPVWAAWVGWILGIMFGFVTFYQFITDKASRGNIAAARNALRALRVMCTEAIDSGKIINSAETRQFVRSIAYIAVAAEGCLDAVLDPKRLLNKTNPTEQQYPQQTKAS